MRTEIARQQHQEGQGPVHHTVAASAAAAAAASSPADTHASTSKQLARAFADEVETAALSALAGVAGVGDGAAATTASGGDAAGCRPSFYPAAGAPITQPTALASSPLSSLPSLSSPYGGVYAKIGSGTTGGEEGDACEVAIANLDITTETGATDNQFGSSTSNSTSSGISSSISRKNGNPLLSPHHSPGILNERPCPSPSTERETRRVRELLNEKQKGFNAV